MLYESIEKYYKDIIINLSEIYESIWGELLHYNKIRSKKKRLKRIKHFK